MYKAVDRRTRSNATDHSLPVEPDGITMGSDQSRQRRAFSQIGGTITRAGNEETAQQLEQAWKAATGDGRILTHGFHPYPARAHPLLIRSLLKSFSKPGQLVVDPFSGSGTVAVEALAASRLFVGTEINRVAIAVARTRLLPLDREGRRRLEECASAVAGRAAKRRRGHVSIDLPASLARQFPEQTLLELTTLRDVVDRLEQATERTVLQTVLSSLLIKLSSRRSETDPRQTGGRHPPGVTYRLFRERTTELALALRDLERAAAQAGRRPLLLVGDARRLPLKKGVADLVLTSPPYLGTYDYSGIQELREAFFGLTPSHRSLLEIGARTAPGRSHAPALDRYRDDLTTVLAEARRVLRKGRPALLILGDSTVGDRFIDALRVVRDAAKAAGLVFVARASQARPKARKKGAEEHLIALSRP